MDDIDEIENFRNSKGLTIAALAADLGVTPYYLGQVLKRKKQLTESLRARFIAMQAQQSPSFRDVVPLVVRFTAEEWAAMQRQLPPGVDLEERLRSYMMGELIREARATVAAALEAEGTPLPDYIATQEPFA